ncbi:peptidoglycan-associated lipoprotein Pal [Geomesophilobacter sediminis]|uniref:Peptidoglycan-associated lipoprotein n=1 Tax=Geomesophilobacter sediminis TaxID=2798584 RepID=A0A8J7S8V8_9BACT|nr:peptidoglycan-associated lipoprotein Pal [Geomesophilobacter sediminis]MBJ6727837.1 peptidoglycan-associated lipoprotein Pal [Geomesophilobacter sediminis]
MRGKVVNLVLIGALVLAAGCSKQGMVKKDEPIAPSAAAATKPAIVPETKAAANPAPAQNTAAAPAPVQAQPVVADNGNGAQGAKSADALKTDLQRIYFAFDSYALTKEDRDILTKNLEVLKKAANAKVQIAGNCDERGSDDYNLALGEERAREAKKYLVTLGIPAERLSVISYGKEKPLDPGHDEAAWAKNRRDDFVIQ